MRFPPLAILTILILSACSVTDEANRNLRDGERLTAEQLQAQRAAQRGEILKIDAPYYGSAVPVKRGSRQGDPLPKNVEGARGVSLKLPAQSDISTIAAAITAATDIQVNIRTRYVIGNGDVVEVPVGSRMRVNYEGSLSALMDRIAARMDVAWTHESGTITIDRMVAKDYRVPLPETSSNFTSTLGGATGTREGETTIRLETTRESDPWAELTSRLAPLTPPPARLTTLPSSGRISVFGPPSVHKAVRKVIEDVESIYGQRVGLEVGVYFLDSDNAESFGLNTGGFLIGQNLARSGNSIVIGGTSPGSVSLANPATGSSVNFEALARDRAVVDHRLASTIAQSGVVAPIAITRLETYIERVEVERDEDGTSIEVTPGEVEFGISVHAVPRILSDNRIQLFLTVLQSELEGGRVPTEEFAGGDFRIGLPVLDQRTIQNQSILSPNEVLVLSGYEQDLSSRGSSGVGVFKALGLGGKREARTRKVRMVVLVRPSLITSRGRS